MLFFNRERETEGCPPERREKGKEKMMYTSAEANKLLSGLNTEHDMLLRKEQDSRAFTAATCENLEDARQEYDYAEVQVKLAEIEERIRKVKHAINVFNVTHEIPGFGMTIDQVLVFLPQLTQRRQKLLGMSLKRAKRRLDCDSGSDLIEYEYANYDVAEANADFKAASETLARLQNALDVENNTVKFRIDL